MKLLKDNIWYSISLLLFVVFLSLSFLFFANRTDPNNPNLFIVLFHISLCLSIAMYLVNDFFDEAKYYNFIVLAAAIIMVGMEIYLVCFDVGVLNGQNINTVAPTCVFCYLGILSLGSIIILRFLFKVIKYLYSSKSKNH